MPALYTSLPAQVLAGLILFGLATAVRALTRNRVVRSRVRLTMVLAVLFVGISAAIAAPDLLREETRRIAVSVSQLLLAFALIHFLVLVLVNPLRADRVPDYFPTIVQDVLVFYDDGVLGLTTGDLTRDEVLAMAATIHRDGDTIAFAATPPPDWVFTESRPGAVFTHDDALTADAARLKDELGSWLNATTTVPAG